MRRAAAVSLALHAVLLGVPALALLLAPAAAPRPEIPAELELVLGRDGQAPGEPQRAADPAPESPPAPPPDPGDGQASPAAPPQTPAVRLGDGALGATAELDDPAGQFRPAQAEGANLPPVYPRQSGATRQQGHVLTRMHVDSEGRVVQVEVLRSSGFAALDRAAREALGRWRFKPARRDGQAVEDSVDLDINFKLD